ILNALIRAGHTVDALARSETAAADMVARGATAVRGNLQSPTTWVNSLRGADVVIHAAATFEDDEEAVDDIFVSALIDGAQKRDRALRVLYTGGCWLYGETGDEIATETSPYAAPAAFQWAVRHSARLHAVGADGGIEAITLHPAMVYGDGGGVFDRFAADARNNGRIQLWGSGKIRWPVVHRDDVGEAYRLAAERGVAGEHYNLSAESGLATGKIADAIARRFGATGLHEILPREQALATHGIWAEGPMIDQQMSGTKARISLGWKPEWTNACAFIEDDMKFPA
ncbi:MAG: NAD-dependent epimerase/dehydratase family protein, partial [Pikeienuella sp.]